MAQDNRDRRFSPSQIDDRMQSRHVGCETVPALPTDDQSVQKRLELLLLFIIDLSERHEILHGRVAIRRVLPCTAVSRLDQ